MISHDFFIFGPFFFLKNLLLEMLIAFGNEHLKRNLSKDITLQCPQSLFIPSLPVCESHNFPKVSFLSPRLMDQQIVISTLYHPSLPNVQWRLSIVTHCNLWLFIYPCILFTSTKHLRTNILTSGSVFPLYPSLRYTYIAHCF